MDLRPNDAYPHFHHFQVLIRNLHDVAVLADHLQSSQEAFHLIGSDAIVAAVVGDLHVEISSFVDAYPAEDHHRQVMAYEVTDAVTGIVAAMRVVNYYCCSDYPVRVWNVQRHQ